MRTPWNLARAAAAALAGSNPAQSFAFTRYGRPLVVSLGGEGTAQTLPPPPRAVLSLDDAADGGTSAPTLRLGLGLLVPSHVDPDTGGDRDPSKPALAPAGFREIGDGAGALALARLCADTVAAALEPHGVFLESRAFNPFIGQPAGDVVTCSLSFTLALGLFGPAEDPGEPDEIRTPHPPAP